MDKRHQIVWTVVLIIVLSAVSGTAAREDQVVRCPAPDKPLNERWQWARDAAAGTGKPHWIGYSIRRLMDRNSYTGSFSDNPHRDHPTLCELLGGGECSHEPTIEDESGARQGIDGEKVLKEVGILAEYREDGKTIDKAVVSNLSLHVTLNGEPLYWLGSSDDSSSVRLLESLYGKIEGSDVKKSLITAISMHDATTLNVSFLGGILHGEDETEIRRDAAFWIGQIGTAECLLLLSDAARNDRSPSIQEHCVFSISEIHGDAADDTLIALAWSAPDRETQKKAIFWLGQKATKKATATLEEVASSDSNTELQKSALFALTQLPGDQGIDPLITIAKTHANPKIRKEAIFWLGQSDNEKALNAIIDILKK